MAFKVQVLVITVVLLWTFVSGNKRFSVLLRDETFTRQEYDEKLSDRLDKIERLLFMEDAMEETLIMTQHLPEIIDNVRKLTESMDSLNNITTRALEQNENNFTAVFDTLAVLANRMKTIEEKLSKNSEGRTTTPIIKEERTTTPTIKEEITTTPIMKEEIQHPSCLSLHQSGQTVNGVYTIYPAEDGVAVPVYCDMTTDGGGWTVFQRRQDGTIDFFRDWDAYRHGFGNVDGEFWLGNDLIADLTSGCCHELRVDMGDFDGARRYAHYDNFKVSPESDNYKLAVGGYSGDAGDSLSYHNNMQFTTKDRDHDKWSSNCATSNKGGWWYKHCHRSHLNGLYQRGAHTAHAQGVNWYHWRGYRYSLKTTEMKLR